ncbi:ATP-binding protein [Catenovulum sp. 2E275]|uniref:hybrid sensor histidine kinase/response regulator n=1 Tax=Catenovulum sp. 2E275 TaxID=2980497 RepID=UPI0021D0C000|nr:ATP-binding protein [Catenovulum sp. 2E275]MCU4675314.1 ATP-binding protein [Catenovulum sp. 2E275]
MSFLRTFHNIVTDQALSFDQKSQALLSFGLQVFQLDIGIISQVEDNHYTVIYVACYNQELQTGASFPLENTYCVHTLKADKALSFHHAGQSKIATHPCYQNFQLESYIGAPIKIDGKTYGTVNFSSVEPSLPFTSEHIDYIELFAQWLGAELSRNQFIYELEVNNKTLQKLESAAKIGTWQFNLVNNHIDWSAQTKILHEVSPDYQPNIQDALAFYKSTDDQNLISEAIEVAIQTGESWNLELEIITAKNKAVWVATKGSAEFVNGKCIRLFGTIQDITDSVELRQELRRKKEEAEFALAERSKLFAKISHELRTPLNGIIGMLTAAIDEGDNSRRRDKLKVALRSSDLLLCIINEVLDYSKISYGELSLEPSHFLLETVFVDLVSLFTPLCQNKSIQLRHKLEIENATYVHFDVTRLGQIVSNLLNNAIKFTHSGYVELTVHTRKIDHQILLTLSVSDTGIGMSQSTLNALFKPFVQGAENISQKYGGTGLGLSIVKELVEMMEGEIKVESELGVGTTFTVNLTMFEGVQETHESEPIPQIKDAEILKVLVVDDNEINRIVMESCLLKINIKPEFAIDGRDAVFKCRKTQYDLIFMDCIMPEMDGWQATKQIRKERLISPEVPVAALTANTSESDKLECKKAGMDLFITKPIKLPMLYKAVKEAIDVKACKQLV